MKINAQKLLNHAERAVKKSDFKEAKKIYLEVLEAYPKNHKAKKGLDELIEARNAKDKVGLSIEQINLVMSLYSNGKPQEALDQIQDLLKNHSKEPVLFNIQGACFQSIGKFDDAVKSYEIALKIQPDYVEVHYNLGIVLKNLNKLELAVESYKNAVRLRPNYPAAHNNLGTTLRELGQLNEAIEHLEWAIAYNRDFADAYYNLGIVYHNLRKHNDAINCYEKALVINPSMFNANFNLGIVYMELGKTDEAINNYEAAINLKPDFARAYLNLTEIKFIKKDDPLINKINSLISSKLISESDQVLLFFALAKINQDNENYDEFFKFLHKGNKLRKKELGYSIDNSKAIHSELIKLFSGSQALIDKSILKESKLIKPIFIIGMPRSGTSLVEQIVASHHRVYGAGELNNLSEFVKPIVEKYFFKDNQKLKKNDLKLLREKYLDLLSSFNVEEKVITDKMPLNFRYVGFILSAFPEAKIIHLKRDPVATCWSNYTRYFTNGNGFSFDMDDLVDFYNMYLDLMEFWHQKFPGKIYDMSYENLTFNQEDETRKLLEYCELEWDESCLSFYTNKRAVKTASAVQVRQKMYQGSSEAWRQYESYLDPLIQAFN